MGTLSRTATDSDRIRALVTAHCPAQAEHRNALAAESDRALASPHTAHRSSSTRYTAAAPTSSLSNYYAKPTPGTGLIVALTSDDADTTEGPEGDRGLPAPLREGRPPQRPVLRETPPFRTRAGNVYRPSRRIKCMRSARPTVILMCGMVTLLFLGGVVAVLVWSSDGGSSAAAPEPAPVTAAVPFASSDATRLESALRSGDTTAVATAIAVPGGQQLDDGFVRQLAAMNLHIEASTFVAQDSRTATVEATTGNAKRWVLLLTVPSTDWLLTATVPLS